MKGSHEDTKARRGLERISPGTESANKSQKEEPQGSSPDPNLRGFVTSCEAKDKEELSRIVVNCGFRLHKALGPGLLESVYERVLAKMLEEEGLKVRRQVVIPINVFDLHFDEGFRADILVEDLLLLELKSVEKLAPVHSKQVLTYLRLLDLPLGLLINYGAPTFKEGCKRIVNGDQSFASSCLRVNQTEGAGS